MDVTRIHEYTDIYMEAYMRALNKTHNADLAVQVAMGVTFAVTNTLEAQKPKAEAQPQTLRIIERVKARESPRQQARKSKKRREMRCRKSTKNWRTIDQY